ncbi:NAD-binding protein [Aestuariimicrobium sp. p3-SID1156]|uniref:potassium channel family protein n=1 Tax=Aestuariimicrobium sp. p3-SID1156 TaxID=2916038 RepID=UPI00223A705C|nr:potassium channel protein [Aestuariimicrobium sp. p3-SID1156]MCT1459510.1 NAD-binding protein [Aestuariimicrobium sp. p3-SID1156]
MTAEKRDRSVQRGARGWRQETLVSLPQRQYRSAISELSGRVVMALAILLLATLIVYLDRGAYSDNVNGDGFDFIDALYYSTVTITTTGYGDLTPAAPHARLINALVITPLRIAFLVLLVGTTLEVLANEGARGIRDTGWRKRMRHHTVVIGYGTKGRSAIATMLRHDIPREKIVVIDESAQAISDANYDGLAAIRGDATRRDLLRRAEITKAREIIITLDRDDSAILAVLTVRQMNPRAHVVVAVRDHENASLLRRSGADMVVTSSDAVGRLMGLSSVNPHVGNVMEDLLSSGVGMEVAERQVTPEEVGRSVDQIEGEKIVAVVRNETVRRFFDSTVATLKAGDRVVVVRRSQHQDPHDVITREDDF